MDGRSKRRIEAMRKVQACALDLFEKRGFDQVTIEEIAEMAGVGPATIYRNFGTKEQLVLWDEYDPMLFDALTARLSEMPLLPAVQQAFVDAFASMYDQDAERILRRSRISLNHPSVAAASAAGTTELRRALSAVFRCAGVAKNDLEADVLGGTICTTLVCAIEHWVQENGKVPLPTMLRRALACLDRLGQVSSS